MVLPTLCNKMDRHMIKASDTLATTLFEGAGCFEEAKTKSQLNSKHHNLELLMENADIRFEYLTTKEIRTFHGEL